MTPGVFERPTPGVGVAVMDGGRVLLIKRGNDPGRGLWAVPGGKVEWGESLIETARREALEETGLEVEVGEVIWVGESIGPGEPPAWHYVIVDFRATLVGGALRPAGDVVDAGWFDPTKAMSLPLTPTMPALLARL